MQAKDIRPDDVLIAIRQVRTGIGASRWKVGTFLGVPEKVMLAKLRHMTLSGILRGCYCGCRGDFTIVGEED